MVIPIIPSSRTNKRTRISAKAILVLVVLVLNTLIILFITFPDATNAVPDIPRLTVKDIERDVPAKRHDSQKVNLSFENGGLVLFFHIPKSAGTSITADVKKQPNVFEFIQSDNRYEDKSFSVAERRIEELTETFPHSDSKIRFVEFHGKNPTFSEQYTKIKRWRDRAASINMPFFVFSISRDPIDTQISIFNFFCIQLDKYVKCGVPHTIEGLLKKCPPDPQTRWLCHSSETFTAGDLDCPHLHEQIIDQMDWMGTMEKIDQTYDVINQVMYPHKLHNIKKNKGRIHDGVSRKNLDKTMIRRLEESTNVDATLYRMVKDRYRMADFLSDLNVSNS